MALKISDKEMDARMNSDIYLYSNNRAYRIDSRSTYFSEDQN